MIFADVQLAARIEKAECRLLRDAVNAVARRGPDAGVFLQDIAGGLAAFTGPGSPLNKVAGLGFAGPPDKEQLTGVERAFHQHGARVQVELSNLADPAIGASL